MNAFRGNSGDAYHDPLEQFIGFVESGVNQLSKGIVEWLNGSCFPEVLIVPQETRRIELTPTAFRHTMPQSCAIITVMELL